MVEFAEDICAFIRDLHVDVFEVWALLVSMYIPIYIYIC